MAGVHIASLASSVPHSTAVRLLAALLVVSASCLPPQTSIPSAEGRSDSDGRHAGGEVELASVMGDLQRFSAKLGYAIRSENERLATFYLNEISEVREVLLSIDQHDEMPIAEPTQIILSPAVQSLVEALPSGDFARAQADYELMIDACNRCHAATEHEFLVITPARGKPPFNQDFAPARQAE